MSPQSRRGISRKTGIRIRLGDPIRLGHFLCRPSTSECVLWERGCGNGTHSIKSIQGAEQDLSCSGHRAPVPQMRPHLAGPDASQASQMPPLPSRGVGSDEGQVGTPGALSARYPLRPNALGSPGTLLSATCLLEHLPTHQRISFAMGSFHVSALSLHHRLVTGQAYDNGLQCPGMANIPQRDLPSGEHVRLWLVTVRCGPPASPSHCTFRHRAHTRRGLLNVQSSAATHGHAVTPAGWYPGGG